VLPITNAIDLDKIRPGDERLPSSRLAIIDAGHFVWEEAPTEYVSIVLDATARDGS